MRDRNAWMVASLLLDYPDERGPLRRIEQIRQVIDALPRRAGTPLRSVVDWLAGTPPTDAAAHYVATFDHSRRCCLYLTYYTHGDTRGRGMALLAFSSAYRRAGVRLVDGELADHLGVVLEFAALTDPVAGRRLLEDHRAGVELLRLALLDRHSPYAGVLDAVTLTLPALTREQRAAVARLAADGPPAEDVGLEPYATKPYGTRQYAATEGGGGVRRTREQVRS